MSRVVSSTNLAAVLLLSGGMTFGVSPKVQAADLGGDCCSDLEERVAVLEATTARKGNRKVSFKISGQVNYALMYWDNGQEDDVYVVDNDSSTSRLKFKGKAKINSDWSAGYYIEIGVHSSESDRVDAGNAIAGKNTARGDDGSGARIALRESQWFVQSKTYGKLVVGLADHALDHTAYQDVSGTHIIARNGGLRFIEDFAIINSNGTVNQNTDWDDIFPGDLEFDVDNVVRYETPTIGGFKLSASWGEDDEYSFAAFYKGTVGDFKIAAAAGYGIDEEGDRIEVINGSFSIIHKPSGLFVTTSGGNRERDRDGREEEVFQVKGGIQQKWSSLGKTTLYGEYLHTDIDTHGEGEIFGLGAVQKIDAAAMDWYIGYRHYEADLESGVATEDFQTVVTGARIKF